MVLTSKPILISNMLGKDFEKDGSALCPMLEFYGLHDLGLLRRNSQKVLSLLVVVVVVVFFFFGEYEPSQLHC